MVKRMRTDGSKLDILRHCFENMNIPVPWEDFDVQRGKIEDYKKRRVSVHKEMFLLMVVNLMFHLLMLVPLIYTGESFQENCLLSPEIISAGTNIIGRHDLLRRTIGTRAEEDESYRNLLILLPCWIVFVITFSILEMVLYFLYSLKVCKSWKNNSTSNVKCYFIQFHPTSLMFKTTKATENNK